MSLGPLEVHPEMCQTDSQCCCWWWCHLKKNLILICAFFKRKKKKKIYHVSCWQAGRGGASYQLSPAHSRLHTLDASSHESHWGQPQPSPRFHWWTICWVWQRDDHFLFLFRGKLFISNRLSSNTCWAGRTRRSPAVTLPFLLPPYLVINRGLL